MPQIAILEIYQDHCQAAIDTLQLKEFLVGINNKTYADISSLKTAIENFLTEELHIVGSDIKIIPQSNFSPIDFTQKSKIEKLTKTITEGLRFICQQTAQPFIGRISLHYENNIVAIDDMFLNNILLELRNKKFTPQSYAVEIMTRIATLPLDEFVVVINLNRRGGISQTTIRSNFAVDYSSLSQRGILE